MTDNIPSTQEQQESQPNPALKALQIMVGVWDLEGRDFTIKEEIRGQRIPVALSDIEDS